MFSDAHYETTDAKNVEFSGYPGNQPTYGFRFKNGGSLIHSPGGSPSTSASVSFGYLFGSINVSVPLGNANQVSGEISAAYPVPNTDGYYKLKIYTTYSIKPFKTFIRYFDESTWSYKWREHSFTFTKEHLSTYGEVVRVK